MSEDIPDKKPIGIWFAVAIGVGGMIGAGIFSILGIATTITGNLIYISFLIGGANVSYLMYWSKLRSP